MEKIIDIIMERDEMSRKEAAEIVREARELILEAAENDEPEEAEEILYDMLGLELDYLPDLIL